MGLPVSWASLGPKQKQQVARLPHPPQESTCAHFLEVRKRSVAERVRLLSLDRCKIGSQGTDRQNCWTVGDLS